MSLETYFNIYVIWPYVIWESTIAYNTAGLRIDKATEMVKGMGNVKQKMWRPLGRLSDRAKLIFDRVNKKFNKKISRCRGGEVEKSH